MQHAALAGLPNVMGPAMAGRPQPDPKHERTTGGSAFYQIYDTADGRHLVLGGQEIKFVRNLLGRLERLDLVPLCEGGPGPHQRRDARRVGTECVSTCIFRCTPVLSQKKKKN